MNKENKNTRNLGLDFLRIISMVMIISLHYFSRSEMLKFTEIHHFSNVLTWTLEAFCIVAVNCYVLISSYFLVKGKFKIKKLFKLIIEVVFYTLTIYFIFICFGKQQFSIDSFINNLFPTLTMQYWFVTVYLVMYILSPFLNKLISNLSKNEHRNLIIILVFIFSIWFSIMPFARNLDTTNGYSIVWFITLYFIVAYIRLYKNEEIKLKSRIKYLFVYALISILVVASKYFLYFLFQKQILTADYSSIYYNYNAITILLSSICLFMFFKDFKIKNKFFTKLILFLSPLTFGVYLIHEHTLLRFSLYSEILHADKYIYSRKYIFVAVIYILLIYIVCSLIDYIRKILFEKISKLILLLQNNIKKLEKNR